MPIMSSFLNIQKKKSRNKVTGDTNNSCYTFFVEYANVLVNEKGFLVFIDKTNQKETSFLSKRFT